MVEWLDVIGVLASGLAMLGGSAAAWVARSASAQSRAGSECVTTGVASLATETRAGFERIAGELERVAVELEGVAGDLASQDRELQSLGRLAARLAERLEQVEIDRRVGH